MADGTANDVYLTLGELKEFLNGITLPDDAMVLVEETSIEDSRETVEAPVVRISAALGIGQGSVVVLRTF